MLDKMYAMVTPWAIAGKSQMLKNRIIGKVTNYIYPIYCKLQTIDSIVPNVEKKSNEEIIISLTSFPARIEKVYLCVNSLLRQKVNYLTWKILKGL